MFKSELGRKLHELNHALPALSLAEGAAGELTLSGHTVTEGGHSNGVKSAAMAPEFIPGGDPGPAQEDQSLCSILALYPYIETLPLVANYRVLRELLQPKHDYFADKWGWLKSFYEYKFTAASAGSVYYPVVTYDDAYAKKNNPYRKYELSRSHSGRTVEQLKGVIDTNKLADVRLAEVTVTIPAAVSAELAARGDAGRRIFWAFFAKWLKVDFVAICGIAGELAILANQHTWLTKKPVKPHNHAHVAILNYQVINGKLEKWFGLGLGKLYRDDSGKVRRGPVAVSYTQLEALKIAAADRLRAACRRNGISLASIPDKLDINFNPAAVWDKPDGRARIIHWLNYMRRSPLEDYAKYSNENPSCPGPPEFITGYRNISRPFGWWKRLKDYGGVVAKAQAGDIQKISPVTGEAMVYIGPATLAGLMSAPAGPLYAFDMVKGLPVVTQLDLVALAWLISVSKLPPDERFTWQKNDANFNTVMANIEALNGSPGHTGARCETLGVQGTKSPHGSLLGGG